MAEFQVKFQDGESFGVELEKGKPSFKAGFGEQINMGADLSNYWNKDETQAAINNAVEGLGDIDAAGEKVGGKTVYPYNVAQVISYEEFEKELLDPVVAQRGAEIFNDYEHNVATGLWANARGCGNQALGDFSDASGWLTKAGGFCSISSGRQTECAGNYSHAEGHSTKAMANDTHAEGEGCQALNARAHAEGYYTTAKANQAHSEGMNTVASGVNSHAEGWGTTASGQNSFSGGKNTVASGTNSTAKGLGTIAKGAQQTALGKYNIADTTNLLIVGNGSGDAARSNVLTLNSSGNLWAAGTVTSAGADYAEFFEWADGNPDAEDRVGMAVTLDGEKIRFAKDGDDILGIVTGTAMVLGDNAAYEWKNKYITDDYGRIVYDEPVEEFAEYTDYVDPEDKSTWVTVKESTGLHVYPKVNTDYDPDKEYVGRESRKEWDAIGMLGKLHTNDDGTCVVNGYAKIGTDGILTRSEEKTNMRVMKRVSGNIVLVMMK